MREQLQEEKKRDENKYYQKKTKLSKIPILILASTSNMKLTKNARPERDKRSDDGDEDKIIRKRKDCLW